MKPIRILPFLLGWLALTVPLRGQSAMDNPATTIMHKVVEKMRVNEGLKRRHLNFNKHYVITDLDDSGRAVRIGSDKLIDVRPPNGDEVLIREDGKNKNKKQDSGSEFETIMEALERRFDYEMARPTADCPTCPLVSKDGRAYLVINFRAYGNIDTGGDDIKEIMNRSAGKMYVDIENLYIQRFESNMTSVYKRGGGAWQLKQADVVLEQGEVDAPEGKIIVVRSTVINYRYHIIILGETRGIRSWTYENYRYIP